MAEALIATAKPRLLASVRRQATLQTIGDLIRNSGIWDMMRARGIESTGHNVVVYWDEPGRNLLQTREGVAVDIAAEILEPFESDDELSCTATPPGRFISMLHTGPYNRLGETYTALHRYCHAQGIAFVGPYWEFYGHWTDDPAQLETSVYRSIA